jgi:hypothetical protein
MGVENLTPTGIRSPDRPCYPGRFTSGKETRYPLYRRPSGPQSRSGWVWKISPPPGFDPRTVQPIASRYTKWGIPAHAVTHYTGLNGRSFSKMFKQKRVCDWLSAISTDPNSLSFGQLDLWSMLLKDAVIYQDPVADKWLMENQWNDTDRAKLKFLEKIVSQCYFLQHKCHMLWPDTEPRPLCDMSN